MDISSTIFDISIQLNQSRYCITGLMYHDMAIYRYIVASLMYILSLYCVGINFHGVQIFVVFVGLLIHKYH